MGGGSLSFLGACLTFTSWYFTSVSCPVCHCSLVIYFIISFLLLGGFPHVNLFRFSFSFYYMLIVVALCKPCASAFTSAFILLPLALFHLLSAHSFSPWFTSACPSWGIRPFHDHFSTLFHPPPAYCSSALAASSHFLLFFILPLAGVVSLVFMHSFVVFSSFSLVRSPFFRQHLLFPPSLLFLGLFFPYADFPPRYLAPLRIVNIFSYGLLLFCFILTCCLPDSLLFFFS